MIRKERLPIILLAMVCLLSGVWSGLSRMGWDIPLLPITAHHGAIMVSGFIGTLISLEKIIPLKRKVLYLIPVLNVMGVISFYVSQPLIAIFLFITAIVGLTVVGVCLCEKQKESN